MSPSLTVRPIGSAAEVEAAQELRVRVFCGEQSVSRAGELDGLDEESLHIVALEGESVVATCRLRFAKSECKLERMAVDRGHRGTGAGGRLLEAAELEARREGAEEIVLHSQIRVRGFYERGGYTAVSEEVFLEERIEHVRMRKAL
ncbi:MAG: GNAT family N-acetyltransferase [Solirubrobacterales bacterium]